MEGITIACGNGGGTVRGIGRIRDIFNRICITMEGNDSEEIPGFAFTYLDGDDVPELVEGYAQACAAAVYAFEKGEVVSVGVYGQYGAMGYREKEGIVFDDYDMDGNVYSIVYQIEGNKEMLLQSYSEKCEFPAEREELQYTYVVNGKEVSGEQYRRICEKWNKTGYRVIDYGMCRTLTDDNIQRILKEELENLLLTQEKVFLGKRCAGRYLVGEGGSFLF